MEYSKSQASQVQISEILSQFWEDIFLVEEADTVSPIAVPPIVERIEWWADAQPELTKALCDYVVQYASQVTEENSAAIVDVIVEKEIADGWGNGLAAAHFNRISQVIMQNERRDTILIVYLQILQRGKVVVNDTLEQAVLVESGLVKAEGGYLKVSNALYKKAFTLEKVEQMLPGITKPVVLAPSADVRARGPATTVSWSSKFAVFACGLVVVGAFISAYIRESGGPALATSNDVSRDAPALASGPIESTPKPSFDTATASPKKIARPKKATTTDRRLFDNGEAYAADSRWVLMMREFCGISETSMYFLPAQKQVEQLFSLYPEDVQLARDLVQAEQGASCSL